MAYSRPFLMLVIVPILAMMIIAGLIFGGQAVSDGRVDSDARAALADALDTSERIELDKVQEVQYGYGLCGVYRVPDSKAGYAPFFYDTSSGNVTLDVDSRVYQSNCSLSAICSL